MSTQHHLAQANWARMRVPAEDPLMDSFRARLDEINALADAAPGFVWRLQDESGNSNAIRAFDDDRILFNLSVWESVETLQEYTYRSRHVELVQGRGTWFETPDRSPLVLWWIPTDHLPPVQEGVERLERLWAEGPSPEAFTFRELFEPT